MSAASLLQLLGLGATSATNPPVARWRPELVGLAFGAANREAEFITADDVGIGGTRSYEALLVDAFDHFPANMNIVVTGRLTPMHGATGTNVNVTIKVPPVDNPGVSGVTSDVVKPKADHTFDCTVRLNFGPGNAPYNVRSEVLVGNTPLTAEPARLTLINANLEWYLDQVAALEAASSVTGLAFVGGIRKVVNSSNDFDPVVGTARAVAANGPRRKIEPAAPKNSLMARRLRAGSHLRFGGELISISHVLIGIEGGRRQDPQPNPPFLGLLPILKHPDKLVTWSGDLGGCLTRFAMDTVYLKKADALTLDGYIAETAGRADLIGDIDGVNLSFDYDEAKSLVENLRQYYVGASARASRRFHRFVDLTADDDGASRLQIEPGGGAPRLTAASREFIAQEILKAASLPLLRRTILNKAVPAALRQRPPQEVEDMLKVDSMQVVRLKEYFVQFLETGLAGE
jgi:hypothetical protein